MVIITINAVLLCRNVRRLIKESKFACVVKKMIREIFMSVVREILGVQPVQQQSSGLATVLSSLTSGGSKQIARKRKSTEKRELANLRDSDTLVMSPPLTPESAMSSKAQHHWAWRKFKNSASVSTDSFLLSHWDNRNDPDIDYSAVRCNVHPEMPLLDPESVPDGISEGELQEVFDTLKNAELNFVVAADKLDTSPERLKQIYYSVYGKAFPARKCKYAYEADVERKRILEAKQKEGGGGSEAKKREKEIVSQIKELENRIKEIDSDAKNLEKFIHPVDPVLPKKVVCASAEKKPPGYDLIYKYLPGVAGASSVPSSVVQLTRTTSIDFSAMTQVPEGCTSFNSRPMMDFFQELSDLHEAEKALSSFIKKRECDIKNLRKNLSTS